MMIIEHLFKSMFAEELNDPNEAFQDFLISLIPTNILLDVIIKGDKCYYDNIDKFLK